MNKRRLQRKPRTKSQSLCSCGYWHCDPIFGIKPSIATRKIQQRLSAGLCMGCGHDPCTCKRKGEVYATRLPAKSNR